MATNTHVPDFAPDIFKAIGVKGNSTSLLTTGVYGIVKLCASLIYVSFVIDRVGRRVPLLIGAFVQGLAMVYIGLYTRFDNPKGKEYTGVPAGGIVGIILIYMYSIGWSFGHSIAPYVTAAEIFPSRIRSTCVGICLFSNWIMNFGITKATPLMMTHMGYGTFLFFGVSTWIGCIWIWLCLPELKGRSIESMDDLFSRSLWTMWKHAYPTEEEKTRSGVQNNDSKVYEDEENIPSANDKQNEHIHIERK